MKNLIKLFALSLATLVLLAGCDKSNQVEKPKDNILVGNWKADFNSSTNELVFKPDNVVIVNQTLINKVGECNYLYTYETTYSYNEKTKEVTLEVDNSKLIRKINASSQLVNGVQVHKLECDTTTKPKQELNLGVNSDGTLKKTFVVDTENKTITFKAFQILPIGPDGIVFKKQ